MKKLSMLIGILLLSNIAVADCSYNGQDFPEGTVIGPYVCVNGEWITR